MVSELSIGTWGLAGESYGPVDEADAEKVVRRAVDMGFTLIDTADAYGGGRMELLVGKILKDHPDLVVVTKGGVDRTTDPTRKTFDPAFLRTSVERSGETGGRIDLAVHEAVLRHDVQIGDLGDQHAIILPRAFRDARRRRGLAQESQRATAADRSASRQASTAD